MCSSLLPENAILSLDSSVKVREGLCACAKLLDFRLQLLYLLSNLSIFPEEECNRAILQGPLSASSGMRFVFCQILAQAPAGSPAAPTKRALLIGINSYSHSTNDVTVPTALRAPDAMSRC